LNGLRDTISSVSHLSKGIFVENTTPSALIDIDNLCNLLIVSYAFLMGNALNTGYPSIGVNKKSIGVT